MMRMDISAASVVYTTDTVLFDDPGFPYIVEVNAAANPKRITRLCLRSRKGSSSQIASAALRQLPLRQLAHLALVHDVDAPHDEIYYRMLAAPKPPGARSWPEAHWERVANVATWVEGVNRPGGASRAVADMWGVTVRPTAYKWIRIATAKGKLNLP